MYFITVFTEYTVDPKTHIPHIGSSRTVGYYMSRLDATDAVEMNHLDIWEYTYDYAVIEHIEEGQYVLADERLFYKYNMDTERYEQISSDGFNDCFGNFAFG